MLDRIDSEVSDRVATVVRRIMGRRADARPIAFEDDLRAYGLTSLEVVNLMLSVETEFAVKIPERDMLPANFRSIARITDLVGLLLHQPAD